MLSFFPRGVLDEILNLIESVSEEFPSYSSMARKCCPIGQNFGQCSIFNTALIGLGGGEGTSIDWLIQLVCFLCFFTDQHQSTKLV